MQRIADAFAMDDVTWERHANPWSAWTRLPILPLMALAVWSRAWIGWWCMLPLVLLAAWTWINPRAFPPPASTRGWASRAVMGERVWLARDRLPIPGHHRRAARLLAALSALGLPPLAWGLWAYSLPWLLLGLALVLGGKLWFLDRMAWLFDDMARTHDHYRRWLR